MTPRSCLFALLLVLTPLSVANRWARAQTPADPAKGRTTTPSHEERIASARSILEAARARASEALLRAFDREIARIDPKNERLAGERQALKGELAQFEASRTMPRNPRMKAGAGTYESACSAARREYRATVLQVASELRKAKRIDEAETVQTDLASFCPDLIDPREFAVKMRPFAERVHAKILNRQTGLHDIRDEFSGLVEDTANHRISAEDLLARVKALIAEIEKSGPLSKPDPKNRVAGDALREALGQLRTCVPS